MLFELLFIDMHRNCTRIGFEVRACTASSPHVRKKNLLYKLMCVISIFIRIFLCFRAIHKIYLISNYFRTIVYHNLLVNSCGLYSSHPWIIATGCSANIHKCRPQINAVACIWPFNQIHWIAGLHKDLPRECSFRQDILHSCI